MSVTSMSSTSVIKLSLSDVFKKNIKAEADKLGISVQDFIRMIVARYLDAKSRTKSRGMVLRDSDDMMYLSEDSFSKTWDNEEDAVYDKFLE